MLQAFASSNAPTDAYFGPQEVSTSNTIEIIRREAADLVAQNRLLEASARVSDALDQHPESQELLAMMGLICEVRHDWPRARSYLEQLAGIQAEAVTAQTLGHLVRVIRCQGSLEQALECAENGLRRYPSDVMLRSEVETLRSMISSEAKKRA